jgi:hypothetical protein
VSILAVSVAGLGVEVILALGVTRDVVWVEVIGGAADGVVYDVLLGLHGLSH